MTTLNGSLVTSDNRVDAERYLIRHYLDTDHTAKPQRSVRAASKHNVLYQFVALFIDTLRSQTAHWVVA